MLGLQDGLLAYETAALADTKSNRKKYMEVFVSGMNDPKRSLYYRWSCFKHYAVHNIVAQYVMVLFVLHH